MLHSDIDLHKRTIAIPLSWGSGVAAARPNAREKVATSRTTGRGGRLTGAAARCSLCYEVLGNIALSSCSG